MTWSINKVLFPAVLRVASFIKLALVAPQIDVIAENIDDARRNIVQANQELLDVFLARVQAQLVYVCFFQAERYQIAARRRKGCMIFIVVGILAALILGLTLRKS